MQPQVPCPTLAQRGWPWTPQGPFPAGNENLFSHSKGRNRKQLNQAFWVFWPWAVGLVANFPSHAEPAPSPGPLTPRGKLSLAPRCPRRRRARVCVCTHLCSLGCSQRFRSSLPGPAQSTQTEAHRWLATPQQHWAQPQDRADGAVRGPFANPS